MVNFVALYRGATISEARMIAVTTEPCIVAEVASHLLKEPSETQDPIVHCLEEGRQRALRLIKDETGE